MHRYLPLLLLVMISVTAYSPPPETNVIETKLGEEADVVLSNNDDYGSVVSTVHNVESKSLVPGSRYEYTVSSSKNSTASLNIIIGGLYRITNLADLNSTVDHTLLNVPLEIISVAPGEQFSILLERTEDSGYEQQISELFIPNRPNSTLPVRGGDLLPNSTVFLSLLLEQTYTPRTEFLKKALVVLVLLLGAGSVLRRELRKSKKLD